MIASPASSMAALLGRAAAASSSSSGPYQPATVAATYRKERVREEGVAMAEGIGGREEEV